MILEVNEPIVAHIPESANFLSVIQSDNNFNSWLLDNCIDIIIHKDYLELNSEMFFNRNIACFCDETILSRKFIGSINSNVIEFIESCIDAGIYITLPINRYYISAYSQYENYHSSHPLLIYGYDEDKRLVHIADFFNGHYVKATCTFDELLKAYSDVENVKGDASIFKYADIRDQEVERVTIYSPNKNIEMKVSLNTFKVNIEHYLNKSYPEIEMPIKDFSLLTTDDYAFNLNYYGILGNYVIENFKKHMFIFPRPFYLLKAKCTLMIYRLRIILNEVIDEKTLKYLLGLFEELESQCTLAMHQVIKINTSKDIKSVDKIIRLVSEIEKSDEYSMQQLLNAITRFIRADETGNIRRFIRT